MMGYTHNLFVWCFLSLGWLTFYTNGSSRSCNHHHAFAHHFVIHAYSNHCVRAFPVRIECDFFDCDLTCLSEAFLV